MNGNKKNREKNEMKLYLQGDYTKEYLMVI